MPWERLKVEKQRLKLVQAYIEGEASMTVLCKEEGICRKTGYKWYERFIEFGEEGLKDLSKAPHSPHQSYSTDQIQQALDLKLKKRNWGPKKIQAKLKEIYPDEDWPSPSRLYEIFKDHHLVNSRRIRRRVPATAPLGDLVDCNNTWAIDFKGWFLTEDGSKCEPLTITDCFTRFLIRCLHLKKHSVEYVWPVLDEAFREFGLPDRIRSDNGPPFGSIGVGRLTRLGINLIKAGVIPEWIRPAHPEENGRHERFHLTLKQEIASPPKRTLPLQIQAMAEFQHEYNFERPHEGIGMKTPGSIYRPSPRIWNGRLKAPEYDTEKVLVRKVCPSGCIWIKQKEYYIGSSLVGEFVGLQQNEKDDLELYYGPIFLGKLELKKGLIKPKEPVRIVKNKGHRLK